MSSQSSIDIPPGRFIGLWRAHRYSDACIRLLPAKLPENSTQTPGNGRNHQGRVAAVWVYKEIPVHKMVLEEGSTYFKGLLTTGKDIVAETASNAAEHKILHVTIEESAQGLVRVQILPARPERISAGNEETPVIDLSCDSEEDAEANEAVLEFLYNHQLPGDPTVSMLCKMITVADYFGADLCLKACAVRLCELSIDNESMLHVCSVMGKLRNCPRLLVEKLQNALWVGWDRVRKSSDIPQAVQKTLQEALFACLLDKYNDALALITKDLQLTSFCMLPLRSIELWGRSDQLKVDSENTVVVLLNQWWHSQLIPVPAEECKKTLSDLVRPALLSNGYLHYALDKMEWFIPPFKCYKHACLVVDKYGADNLEMDKEPYNKLVVTKRQSSYKAQLSLKWRIPFKSIQTIVGNRVNSSSSSMHSTFNGPEGYWQGHNWRLRFSATTSEYGDEYVQLGFEIMKLEAKAMCDNIPAAADIRIIGGPFDETWKQTLFEGSDAWRAHYHAETQELASEMEEYLNDDNQLVVAVTIVNVE